MALIAFLLGTQHKMNSVKKKPARSLVASLGQALNGMPPFLCGRQVARLTILNKGSRSCRSGPYFHQCREPWKMGNFTLPFPQTQNRVRALKKKALGIRLSVVKELSDVC